jgi:KUP system potassium uptake protein
VIGLGGLRHLFASPDVLTALNPVHGVSFLVSHGMVGFVTLR